MSCENGGCEMGEKIVDAVEDDRKDVVDAWRSECGIVNCEIVNGDIVNCEVK